MSGPEEENNKQTDSLNKVIGPVTWIVIVAGFSLVAYGLVTGLSKIFSM